MAALSQLRNDLQYRYRDTAGKFLSAVPANLFLNLGGEDFSNDVEPAWREYGFYVTAKQHTYNLPSDYLHSLTMMWYQNGQYEIPYLSPQEFKMRGFMNRRITVSTPQAYTIDDGPTGRQLILGPAPGTSSNTTPMDLGNSMTSSQTFILPHDATQFQSPSGVVIVNDPLAIEQVQYQSNDNTVGGQLTLCIRGFGGTAAAVHTVLSGTPMVIQRADLVMMYTYQFKYMVADSDTPNFQSQYHRDIVHYALYLALKADGRDKQADAEMEYYMKKKVDAKRAIRTLTRDRHNKKISSAYN